MSKREKMLGLILAATVPFVFLVFVATWVDGSLDKKTIRLRAIEKQLGEQELLKLERMRAAERRAEYREASLSSDPDNTQNYRAWLNGLADKHNLTDFGLTDNSYGKMRYDGKFDVAFTHQWDIKADGTLPQLVGFLDDFYRMSVLHRINALTVNPRVSGEGGKQVRTGVLSLNIKVEALALVDADERVKLPVEPSDRLEKSRKDYEYSIVRRNIFGFPNNAPSVSVSNQREEENKAISFNIRGRDNDENDQLTFELVEIDPKAGDAKLGAKRSADSTAVEFTHPGLPEGDYKFKVRVTDNGCPAKFSEEEFFVNVKKPEQKKEEKPEVIVKKPTFKHAPQSKITALVQGSDSKSQVWINVRTKGDIYQLKTGDTFQLDDKEWLVQDIMVAENQVVILCDGKELTFERGDFLSDPRNVVEVLTEKSDLAADKDQTKETPVGR